MNVSKVSSLLSKNLRSLIKQWGETVAVWSHVWLSEFPLKSWFLPTVLWPSVSHSMDQWLNWCRTPERATQAKHHSCLCTSRWYKAIHPALHVLYFSLSSTGMFLARSDAANKTAHKPGQGRWHFWLRRWLVNLIQIVFRGKAKYLAELGHVFNVLWDATQQWPSGGTDTFRLNPGLSR